MFELSRSGTPLRVTLLLVLLVLLAHIPESVRGESPPPRVVAHRGLLRHAPENTLSNFRACLELRLGFEFDVERTKDGHLVCLHDDTLDRTTNGTGRVDDRTLDELRRLDAGSGFDPLFASEKIPTIDEVLKLVAEHPEADVLIAVDLKAAGVEQDVVRLAEKQGVIARLLFIGRTIVEPAVRDRLKAASPKARTAAVTNNTDEFPSALSATNADWVYFRYVPSREQMQAVHASGKQAFIAGKTVAGLELEAWKQSLGVGLDGILTDYPLELRSLIRESTRK